MDGFLPELVDPIVTLGPIVFLIVAPLVAYALYLRSKSRAADFR